MTWNTHLPIAPMAPQNDLHQPHWGTYQGALESTSLRKTAPWLDLNALRRRAHEKKWQWFGAFSPELALGGALIRTGYAAQLFLWVFDRRSGTMLSDTSMTLPAPLVHVDDVSHEGEVASYRLGSTRVSVRRDHLGIDIQAQLKGMDISLRMAPSDVPIMTTICPVAELINITQKQAGLATEGVVRFKGHAYAFDANNSVGFLDYTHGLLERRTAWQWAIGAGHCSNGKPLSFNLCAGFTQGAENVAWYDGNLYKLGLATFEFDPSSPHAPWRVTTPNQEVDLRLNVEGVRKENVNLGLVRSVYVQPLGTWSGHIHGHEIKDAVGVGEDHLAVW